MAITTITGASIATAITSATAGDVLLLAARASMGIVEVQTATSFVLHAGEGQRLLAGDRLYIFDPKNEPMNWGVALVSSVVGDLVTITSTASLVNPTATLKAGSVAIPMYNENGMLTVSKALRIIAAPYCAEVFTGKYARFGKGGSGSHPRVMIYGQINVTNTTGCVSLHGFGIVGHAATSSGNGNAIVGADFTSNRPAALMDCLIRPAPNVADTSGRGVARIQYTIRCNVWGDGLTLVRASAIDAVNPSLALVASCVITNWRSATSLSNPLVYCNRLRNTTIFGCQAGYGIRSSAGGQVSNLLLVNNTFTSIGLVGTGSPTAHNVVLYASGNVSGLVQTDVTTLTADPRLSVVGELTDASPAIVKRTKWPAVPYQFQTDMRRIVLDADQHAVGAYAWVEYPSAMFAWTVTEALNGLKGQITTTSGGPQALTPPSERQWLFQSPKELLYWLNAVFLFTWPASSTTPHASGAGTIHWGMNADGKMRIVVGNGGLDVSVTGVEVETRAHTQARWIVGRGYGNTYMDSDTVVYALNYLPSYIATKVRFETGDLGEYQPASIEQHETGGASALKLAVRSYRGTTQITVVTEQDEAQNPLVRWLFQTRNQRVVELLRKASSGCPVRVYFDGQSAVLGSMYEGTKCADMNILDSNADVPLAWAEHVMGRHMFTLDLCELWGL